MYRLDRLCANGKAETVTGHVALHELLRSLVEITIFGEDQFAVAPSSPLGGFSNLILLHLSYCC